MSYPAPDRHWPMRVEDLVPDNETTEVVVDHDMAAAGTGAYTAGNSASLSKVSNGEGGQALRIAEGGNAFPQASQNVLNNTYLYRLRSRIRGDGTFAGKFVANNITDLWTFESDADWQELSTIHMPGGAKIHAQSDATIASGGYCDVDIMSAKIIRPLSKNVIADDHHIVLGSSDITTTWPTQVHDKGLRTSTGENMKVTDPFGTASLLTVSFMFLNESIAGLSDILGAWNASGLFFRYVWLNATNEYWFQTGGTSGLNAAKLIGYRAVGDLIHFVGVYDGSNTKIYGDGVFGAQAATPVAPNYQSQDLRFGHRYTAPTNANFLGKYCDVKVWLGTALTADQCSELYQDDVREYARLHI
jgi:hypothetical protein